MRRSQLLGRGPRIDSAATAVVANPSALIVGDTVVVNIANIRNVHIRNRAVVVNSAIIPISAIIATAGVSETVVDTAVVTNMRTPVTRVPMIVAIIEAPPGRRPERTHIRR
jgi:hypothetical protein